MLRQLVSLATRRLLLRVAGIVARQQFRASNFGQHSDVS
jgi:hypothetical protein